MGGKAGKLRVLQWEAESSGVKAGKLTAVRGKAGRWILVGEAGKLRVVEGRQVSGNFDGLRWNYNRFNSVLLFINAL